MAEWFKAHAWKACVANPYRGFESLPLRQFFLPQSQGVALGYFIRPCRGRCQPGRPNPNHPRLTYLRSPLPTAAPSADALRLRPRWVHRHSEDSATEPSAQIGATPPAEARRPIASTVCHQRWFLKRPDPSNRGHGWRLPGVKRAQGTSNRAISHSGAFSFPGNRPDGAEPHPLPVI